MYDTLRRHCGIGLRPPHHSEVLERPPDVGFLEVHSENFFAHGGMQPAVLARARALFPLSLHGVGLSIGSADPIDRMHLARLTHLVRTYEPMLVSEHLSWASIDGRFTNELLPLPYTEEALRHTAARVRAVQDALGRELLIENISSYLQFNASEMTEWEFLACLVAESGCALLLDLNNVHVNAVNHGFDELEFLNGIPQAAVREIHLAGHSVCHINQRNILLDTHDRPVCDAVWCLYASAVARFGVLPTLIEWDNDLPALHVLVAEAHKTAPIMQGRHAIAA